MSDARFYVVCLLIFGVFVISGVVYLNLMQPNGVDVEVWNRITAPATTIIGLLVLLAHNSRRATEISTQSNQIERKVEMAAFEANTAARNAAIAAGTKVPPKTDDPSVRP